MAASDVLSPEGDSAGAAAAVGVASRSGTASLRLPRLIPVAQLVAVVVGVLTIIWNQQQTTDSLRTELRDEISGVETSLRAEISRVETSLRAEISELRDEVSANGQRLARIEGFLGIGVPGDGPDPTPGERDPPSPEDRPEFGAGLGGGGGVGRDGRLRLGHRPAPRRDPRRAGVGRPSRPNSASKLSPQDKSRSLQRTLDPV
jgi:hypothetical protein